MTKYNIAYLHERGQFGGAESSLFNLANKINKERFKPIFICPSRGNFMAKLRKLGIEVYSMEFPKIRKIFGISPTLKRLNCIIRQNDVHLLHSNSIRTNIYAAISGRLEKIPVIWHQRNLIYNDIIDLDRLFSFLPNIIICNSFAVAARFLKKGQIPDKVRVIHNGVDTAEFKPEISAKEIREEFGIRDDEIVVGLVARFDPIKGHETFFNAAKNLICNTFNSGNKLRFLVIGAAVFDEDKWIEKNLKDMVSSLNIKDRVIFAGFREDMPRIYTATDICVLTSLSEGCGRVVLEAMAAGKPVIATNSGGTPEIVKDGITGFLFEPGDARALADKIAFFVNNITLAKKMGQSGRKRVEENFTIEKNVKKTEEIYRELILEKKQSEKTRLR